jgi:methylmalonic aciduria homocystinuria type C protein
VSHRDLVERVRLKLALAGLDLVQPLSVSWYNAAVEAAYALPDFGRAHALALVVGNTRAMWPVFLAARAADPALRAAPDPIDTYAAHALAGAAAEIAARSEVRLAHEAPPRRVAMQRLADVSGLATLSPSHLNVHPVYGPWIGLRGVIVVDTEGPAERPDPAPRPCDCTATCLPLFRAAMAAPHAGTADIAASWTRWIAVRDACPVGRAHRYSDRQLCYHYLKDPALLDE